MGASFLTEIRARVQGVRPGMGGEEVRIALQDLAWAGWVTNDTVAPLREARRAPRAVPRRRGTRSRPVVGGRWSRVDSLVRADTSATERALARAHVLLERYGVVSREAAHAEELPGGFAAVYKVLRAMEDAGRIRRGHFVEGLAGAQFAHAGAVDRLRASRPSEDEDGIGSAEDAQVLAAVDPANPWGALLPWPENPDAEGTRPRRISGARVVLLRGHPVLWIGPRGRQLLTFPFPGRAPEESVVPALGALQRLPRKSGRWRLHVEEIDGRPVHRSPYVERMRGLGFARTYRGLEMTRV
jgi:ATP-dependent Lhr-like helicase